MVQPRLLPLTNRDGFITRDWRPGKQSFYIFHDPHVLLVTCFIYFICFFFTCLEKRSNPSFRLPTLGGTPLLGVKISYWNSRFHDAQSLLGRWGVGLLVTIVFIWSRLVRNMRRRTLIMHKSCETNKNSSNVVIVSFFSFKRIDSLTWINRNEARGVANGSRVKGKKCYWNQNKYTTST